MDKQPKNIDAFIQVRMGSSRLPGKALAKIDGLTAIERVVNSLKPSEFIKRVIITTTTEPSDDPLESLALDKGILLFRGESINVVKRFFDAAEKFGSEVIVRVTGDCPVVSYEICDFLISSHFKQRADYTAIDTEKVPVGVFSEIISFSALKRLQELAMNPDFSEYLTFYFRNNPAIFSLNIVAAPQEYRFPQYRLTLDYAQDLAMFNELFEKLKKQKLKPSLSNILRILKDYPEVAEINSGLTLKYKADKDLIRKLNEVTKIKVS